MASGTSYNPSASGNAGQVALDKFAAMMIDRMEQMKASDWKKGWIGGASGYAGLPQNVGGRNYSGSNSLFLQLHTAANGYDLPVYLTFKQAHNLKAHVLKGEKAFPVVYWDMLVKDKNGQKISSDEYRAMSREERKDLEAIPFIKAFPVYNVAQTNLAEIQPERMQNYWRSSKCRNLGIPRVCMPMPPLTVWYRFRAGSARYRRTSEWMVLIILPRQIGLLFP